MNSFLGCCHYTACNINALNRVYGGNIYNIYNRWVVWLCTNKVKGIVIGGNEILVITEIYKDHRCEVPVAELALCL